MQPFDGSVFDRRFAETFKPAIEAAGLEAYRVDQDPKVSIPIQDIESGIRDAHICLADITHDNPNVWFELGFAFACKKQVVLVCSDERTTKFPFDVQHRSIIKYQTKSSSDYSELEANITKKLLGYLEKTESLEALSGSAILAQVDGLDQYEIIALGTIAENLDHSDDHASINQIRRDMEANGVTKLATTIAIRRLESSNLIEGQQRHTYQGDEYFGYELTASGWKWLVDNKDKFNLMEPKPRRSLKAVVKPTVKPTAGFDDIDDDIPF
ncbi:MAG: hypothetical protein KDH18_06025 [Rhodoferax sp.]|nr:hypothetical protein [Rhodoferax sp.]